MAASAVTMATDHMTLLQQFAQNVPVERSSMFSEAMIEAQARQRQQQQQQIPNGIADQVAQQTRRLLDAHPNTLVALHARRTCLRCSQPYFERQNIGRWRCTYHPGYVCSDTHVMSCCGTPLHRRVVGCRECDHTDEPELAEVLGRADDPRHCVMVPRFLAGELGDRPRSSAVVSTQQLDTGTWTVHDLRVERDVRTGHEEQAYQKYVEQNSRYVARADYSRVLAPPPPPAAASVRSIYRW